VPRATLIPYADAQSTASNPNSLNPVPTERIEWFFSFVPWGVVCFTKLVHSTPLWIFSTNFGTSSWKGTYGGFGKGIPGVSATSSSDTELLFPKPKSTTAK
jgi:hypothetical protein